MKHRYLCLLASYATLSLDIPCDTSFIAMPPRIDISQPRQKNTCIALLSLRVLLPAYHNTISISSASPRATNRANTPSGPSTHSALHPTSPPEKSGRIPPRTSASFASTCALAKNIGWMPNEATPFPTRRNTLRNVNNKAESGVDERDKIFVFDMTSCGEKCRRVWVRLLLRRGVGPELGRSISWGTYS